MKIVDENLSIRAIEDKIAGGMVEELILQAHNELRLLKIIGNWQPWDHFDLHSNPKEFYNQATNFKFSHPWQDTFENWEHDKNVKPERPPTAGKHSNPQ